MWHIIAAALCAVLLQKTDAQVNSVPGFPSFSYLDHPFYNSDIYQAPRLPEPVALDRYTLHSKWKYMPGAATIRKFDGGAVIMSEIDTFRYAHKGSYFSGKSPTVQVSLNREARIFVLVGFEKSRKKKSGSTNLETFTVRASSSLTSEQQMEVGRNYKLGEAKRVSTEYDPRPNPYTKVENKLLMNISDAVLVEMTNYQKQIQLPRGNELELNGNPMINLYDVLILKPDRSDYFRFPKPALPDLTAVNSILRGLREKELASFSGEEPQPNTYCPTWLHDMWTVRSQRFPTDRPHNDEPDLYRTWHPVIDPIYWCSYQHEHGGFPGPHMPKMDYVTRKVPIPEYTPPKITDKECPADFVPGPLIGRPGHYGPSESNPGFKSFVIHEEDGDKRLIVLTLHVHTSNPRRFTTQFHTVILAVYNRIANSWKREVELYFKMDFGPGVARLEGKKETPQNDVLKYILPCEEHVGNATIENNLSLTSFRRFQVELKNLPNGMQSTRVPASLRPSTKIVTHLSPELAQNVEDGERYEKWLAPLPTCTSSKKKNRHFDFQIRKPSTKVVHDFKDGSDSWNWTFKETVNGKKRNPLEWASDSLIRVLKVKTEFDFNPGDCCLLTEDGKETCKSMDIPKNGVFYTDAYFQKVLSGPGEGAVQQFIDPAMDPVYFRRGNYRVDTTWEQHTKRGDDDTLPYSNTEDALNIMDN